MADLGTFTLTNDWTPLETFVGTVDADTTYYIQCQGPDYMVARQSAATPTTNKGLICVPLDKQLKYKLDADAGDLYLKASTSECEIYITTNSAA